MAAVVPVAGETIAAALRNPQWEVGTANSITMDGISIRISPDAAAELFYHDCADSTAAAAAARLTPEPLRPTLEPSPRFSIGSPTGFMMTLDDRVNPPGAQRAYIARISGMQTVAVHGGHSPFMADPAVFVDDLLELEARVLLKPGPGGAS